MSQVKGQKLTKAIVSEWSKVYINQVFFLENRGNVWQYEVEFSMPKNAKPIPQGTAKIFFSVIDLETGDDNTRF